MSTLYRIKTFKNVLILYLLTFNMFLINNFFKYNLCNMQKSLVLLYVYITKYQNVILQ